MRHAAPMLTLVPVVTALSPPRLAGLAAATAGWLLFATKGVDALARHAPISLQRAVSFTTFRALSQLLTIAVGLGLVRLLAGSLSPLGLSRPTPRRLAGAALLQPLTTTLATWIGVGLAMPVLMEELALRGLGASQRNAGALGRELGQSSIAWLVLSAVVLPAISEELMFRGGLLETVRQALARLGDGRGARLAAWLVPTVASAVAFGLSHADVPGGVGLVRVASTTALGLALGGIRVGTGVIWCSMTVHMLHNATSLAMLRGGFRGLGGATLGVPDVVVGAGLVAGAIGAWLLLRRGAAPSGADAAPDGGESPSLRLRAEDAPAAGRGAHQARLGRRAHGAARGEDDLEAVEHHGAQRHRLAEAIEVAAQKR